MFRTLLVPLDGSPLAERALPYAAALSRASGARLLLLRVATGLELSQQPEFDNAAEAELAEVAHRLRGGGIEAESHVHYLYSLDGVAATIWSAAHERAADLIVMSTHGRSGLGRWLYGSVADGVLRLAELPVLLIPAACERPWPSARPLRMLVPLDGSPLAETVLAPAVELAQQTRASICLLRVVESPLAAAAPDLGAYAAFDPEPELAGAHRYLEAIAGPMRADGRTVEVVTEVGLPISTIDAIARDRDVDLIAIATHGRGGLARLVLGSVATGTLQRAGLPLLLVRPAALRETDAAADTRSPSEGSGSPT